MSIESNILKGNNGKEKARMEVMVVRDYVLRMGANDYEPPAFKQILEDLEAGIISPQQAIENAHKIKESKMDNY
ncbi:hypothetical protein A3B84_00695 [Candidatus Nomurabacteria bacterium RIFCSPHIGHO2_02_FULL_35_13]|uniref:Antitoxin VbhA domain-containing protein n=1 Tax=Candidatus Nomurabacteria bacterium RIFCSPHIGHO2_02_FULL_35_13 TaxID=1801748 RepID=A0A1F6VP12_9BACT|nr:MAG: hypothetical protein A3B84_00695 [Candidatus Nomurabacteria bacterium RIFCSPHIGHO2_02_FULL_35_13]